MGDFNYNLRDPASEGHLLLESLSAMDFRVIRFDDTFFHNAGFFELDCCAVIGLDVVGHSVHLSESPILGGYLWLYFNVVLNDHRHLAPGAPLMRRDLRAYSPDHFCQELAYSDWSTLQNPCVTIDQAAELLNRIFLDVFERLAPLRLVTPSSRTIKIWKTPELLAMEKCCAKLHKTIRRRNFDADLIGQFYQLRHQLQR